MAKRIKDYRALYGAISLFLIGLILSFQSLIYVNMDHYGADLITARWHWEIVLNIQILCFAFIWFSHHNRILFADGWWKVRAILNFLVSFGAVGMPAMLTILGAWNDWYRDPPGQDVTMYMIRIAIYIWVASNILLPLVLKVLSKGVSLRMPGGLTISKAVIAALMVSLFLLNNSLPLNLGYYAAPFLCFLHGALTYVEKSLQVPYYDRGAASSSV